VKGKSDHGAVVTSHEKLGKYYCIFKKRIVCFSRKMKLTRSDFSVFPTILPISKMRFIKSSSTGTTIFWTKKHHGTKFAPVYKLTVKAKGSEKVVLRLTKDEHQNPFADKEEVFTQRLAEAINSLPASRRKMLRSTPRMFSDRLSQPALEQTIFPLRHRSMAQR